MKKYELPLLIVEHHRSERGIALAKYLMDNMKEEEIYQDIDNAKEEYVYSTIKRSPTNWRRALDLLDIEPYVDEYQGLKNYDVPLAMSAAGRVDEAKKIMKYLRKIGGPKKKLTKSDFEKIDEIEELKDTASQLVIEARTKINEEKISQAIIEKIIENDENK